MYMYVYTVWCNLKLSLALCNNTLQLTNFRFTGLVSKFTCLGGVFFLIVEKTTLYYSLYSLALAKIVIIDAF